MPASIVFWMGVCGWVELSFFLEASKAGQLAVQDHFLVALVRQRRLHEQITHVLLTCSLARERYLTLDLEPAKMRLRFVTLWTIARDILTACMEPASVRITIMESEIASACEVELKEKLETMEVWPTVFRRPPQPRPEGHLDTLDDEKKKPKPKSGGVKMVSPATAMRHRIPPRPVAAPPDAGVDAGPHGDDGPPGDPEVQGFTDDSAEEVELLFAPEEPADSQAIGPETNLPCFG